MKNNKVGICRLCGEEKELKQSHIIPEFMYENLYDNSPRRFYSINIKAAGDDNVKRMEQKGIREPLLCRECEAKFSRLERLASETIYAKNKKSKVVLKERYNTKEGRMHVFEGFDYRNFKLFLLSLLWRLLISEKFKTPEVDAGIIENLRAALLNDDPMQFDGFGCLVQSLHYPHGDIAGKFILDPFETEQENSMVINVVIDGFLYSFFLDSRNVCEETKSRFLRENGEMKINAKNLFADMRLMRILFSGFKTMKQ